MESLYEKPSHTADLPPLGEGDDGDLSSGEEDLVDWTKLPFVSRICPSLVAHTEINRSDFSGSSSRVNIPKRGEKDFEPAPGSRLQDYTLNRSREAMVSALRGLRGTSR